jgi:hypothetical protein
LTKDPPEWIMTPKINNHIIERHDVSRLCLSINMWSIKDLPFLRMTCSWCCNSSPAALLRCNMMYLAWEMQKSDAEQDVVVFQVNLLWQLECDLLLPFILDILFVSYVLSFYAVFLTHVSECLFRILVKFSFTVTSLIR